MMDTLRTSRRKLKWTWHSPFLGQRTQTILKTPTRPLPVPGHLTHVTDPDKNTFSAMKGVTSKFLLFVTVSVLLL